MQGGTLRRFVALQERVGTVDAAYGGESSRWSTIDSFYVSIRPITGSILDRARELYAETSHEIMGRWREGTVPSQRIAWIGRIFELGHVANVNEDGRQMRILAKEIVGTMDRRPALLLENLGHFLLESGDYLLLE